MDYRKKFFVEPGGKLHLGRLDPAFTAGHTSEDEASGTIDKDVERLCALQYLLYAENARAVLIVLQAMDAGGKDGTVRHVFRAFNPQGANVHAFKQPTPEEAAHDFLWRAHKAAPQHGQITIFNRSHYEEVLVVRVHPHLLERQQLPPDAMRGDVWRRRYREINDWERHLVGNGIRVVKIFLNLSRQEQANRFLGRIDDPAKNWKFSPDDIRERNYWGDYQKAFEEMLSHTSTKWAPWYVVPADHKWFTQLATAAILVTALADIDPQYPRVAPEILNEMAEARAALLEETAT